MKFEGSGSENPRIPKELFVQDGKPKGPFCLRGNAKELAEKIGWKFVRVEMQGHKSYWVIPHEMDENFNVV